MKVVIDNMLRLQDVSPDVISQIKGELTMKNPEYIKKRAMGLNPYVCGNQYIKLYTEKCVEDQKEYILPRGYHARLWALTKGDFELIDNRVKLPKIEFPKKLSLRDYQAPAIQRAIDWQQGTIIMPCGSGKTETADGIVSEIGQPTLWITHTMDLLQQSKDRAINKLGISGNQVGIIQGENMSIGTHMTFATVQTLSKRDLSGIINKFGCVIVDECHLCFKDDEKSRMFADVLAQFPAFYLLGVTASEYRSDGLIETMFHVIGPKIYEVLQEDPRLLTLKPKIEFVETDFQYTPEDGEMLNTQKMVAAMKNDGPRNEILKNILTNSIQPGEYTLVLGDSLEHLDMLWRHVKLYFNKTAAFICGTTPKKEREKIMAGMRAGKYQYLFATYQLAKLGLDVPILNKLLLATPHKDKTSIQQAVGRIMRPDEGKPQPIVYDVWDSKIPQMRYWARDRVKVYKILGADILGGPKVRS